MNATIEIIHAYSQDTIGYVEDIEVDDCGDDPVTLWASDNGYSVDELELYYHSNETDGSE